MLWMERVVELFTLLRVVESQTAKKKKKCKLQTATLVDDHPKDVDKKILQKSSRVGDLKDDLI